MRKKNKLEQSLADVIKWASGRTMYAYYEDLGVMQHYITTGEEIADAFGMLNSSPIAQSESQNGIILKGRR